jgi:hypothetical protein
MGCIKLTAFKFPVDIQWGITLCYEAVQLHRVAGVRGNVAEREWNNHRLHWKWSKHWIMLRKGSFHLKLCHTENKLYGVKQSKPAEKWHFKQMFSVNTRHKHCVHKPTPASDVFRKEPVTLGSKCTVNCHLISKSYEWKAEFEIALKQY